MPNGHVGGGLAIITGAGVAAAGSAAPYRLRVAPPPGMRFGDRFRCRLGSARSGPLPLLPSKISGKCFGSREGTECPAAAQESTIRLRLRRHWFALHKGRPVREISFGIRPCRASCKRCPHPCAMGFGQGRSAHPWSRIQTREVPSARPSFFSQPPSASNPGVSARQRFGLNCGQVRQPFLKSGFRWRRWGGDWRGRRRRCATSATRTTPRDQYGQRYDHQNIVNTHYFFPLLFSAAQIASRTKRPTRPPEAPATARSFANSEGSILTCRRSVRRSHGGFRSVTTP